MATPAGRDGVQAKAEEVVSGDEIEARPYQLELLDAALIENTIVNLGTGAGKTFIAVMLIRELSHQILDPFREEGAKRTVFLVTTVPLVKQQAQYIEVHGLLKVGIYTGALNVDSWHSERWLREFDDHHVLVMTAAIFKDLIYGGIIHLRQINLIVFDECHHAVKNHMYVQIMKAFNSCSQDEYPRVLGLSASLIPSKCKPGMLEEKIKDLEATLRCRSETAKDLEQVARYATNPNERALHYSPSADDRQIGELRQILQGPLTFLDTFAKKDKTSMYDKVKLYLDDCQHILENLGIWCAHKFAKQGLIVLQDAVREGEACYGRDWDESLAYLGVTHLEIFSKKSQRKLETDYVGKLPVTNKVRVLLDFLANSDQSENLLGIIFVERRTTAAMFKKLVRHKSREDERLGYIRCDYVVGHNLGKGGTHLRKEAHMNIRKQEEVLKKFRKQAINLLLATSVVEEGLDVPRCNLVVRFDFPQNLRAYIQSKGRARAKESTFLIMIDGDRQHEISVQLRNFQALEKELQSLCHDRTIPGEEEILKMMEDIVPPYMPFGVEAGTRATICTSLELVYKYCQKLPSDKYAKLTPVFNLESKAKDQLVGGFAGSDLGDLPQLEGEKHVYRCLLTLPMSCPVKETIQGDWMLTRRIAERFAALEAVKQLHAAGELDDHLRPCTNTGDSDDEDDMKIEERKVATNAGTETRQQYYRNEVASSLRGCFPVAEAGNELYIFIIRDASTKQIFQSLSPHGPHTSFGILSRKPIPYLKVPEFSIYDHEQELSVTVERLKPFLGSLSPEELRILTECHRIIFSEVLGLHSSWLKPVFELSEKDYLVVPISFVLSEVDATDVCPFLDLDLARMVARNPRMKEMVIEWPCLLERFDDALVIDIHRVPAERRLYEVSQDTTGITPCSPFPDPDRAATYLEYFSSKYKFTLDDIFQPGLKCTSVSMSASRLQLLTSRFKDAHGKDAIAGQRSSSLILFPQCCSLHPLPASVWKVVRCLPSILWRIECLLLVDDLRLAIASEALLGKSVNGLERMTHSNLGGYTDLGCGTLETRCFSVADDRSEVVCTLSAQHLCSTAAIGNPLRGPGNALLLQALTLKGANDSINLERLETLGDSFLKVVTSVHLYCELSFAHEGRLSQKRERRVGNFNLYLLAKRKGITRNIFSKSFKPREMWVPPCFMFDENDPTIPHVPIHGQLDGDLQTSSPELKLPEVQRHYQFRKIPDKGVADSVESLLGAYLVSGGIEVGVKFMKWMGIKIGREEGDAIVQGAVEMHSDSSSSSYSASPALKRMKGSSNDSSAASTPDHNSFLCIRGSSSVFADHFGPPPPALLVPGRELEVTRLLMIGRSSLKPEEIQEGIKWTFTDPSLLLQALTHASYLKNRVTDCYQRLEFLGDAVLDYLVTCHIYSTYPKHEPGDISALRSALVNNVTFAEMAVRLNLHKALLHNSLALFRQIPEYVERLMKHTAAPTTPSSHYLYQYEATPSPASELDTEESEMVEDEGDSEEEEEELEPPKVLGDVLESVAGAVFVDSGMSLEKVWSVFRPLIERKIDEFGGEIPIPPVEELFLIEPCAETKFTKSGRGRTQCTVTVAEKGVQVTREAGSTKAAKTAAAKAAIKKLKALAR